MWPFKTFKPRLVTDGKFWAVETRRGRSPSFASGLEFKLSWKNCWTESKEEAEQLLKRILLERGFE